MAGIQLIALDLDGTTLNSQHKLTEKTCSTLRNLSTLGLTIAIVTGRSKTSAIQYIQDLNLSRPVPIICYNGSMCFIIDGKTECKIFSIPIPADPARTLLRFAEKLGLVAQYYDGDSGEVYAVPLNDGHILLLEKYARLVGRKQVYISSFEEIISKSLSAKILILTNEPDELILLAEKNLPLNMFHVIRGSPDPFFVEFLVPGVDKGSALQLLCNHLDMPVQDTIAFGDGENDKEFLAVAGFGCAMKNARPAAKSAANVVIAWTNDEDGVAHQLEKMEAEGRFSYQIKANNV